ncbi:EamA family transporter [Gloeocapsa sp. PCC 73106]|uniref:EamA family transporter n=1 Tax=Gloeocapsa sp. PCC 73106 TaxID=102232 RepID=UPI0002ABBB3D|nr:EamA family transporter [Gloeocapsa sp. PCC 73106]ELR98713.1 putative membrane protein [Gloeocapsa sp. PCC 73106]
MTNFCLLLTLVVTQVLGDIWLSRGMKLFGEVESFNLLRITELLFYLLTNSWIWLGVITLAFSMLIYLVSVSRLDLSYVLPIHSSSYVLNALMAWLILQEQVSFNRWLAAILISIGVFLVSLTPQSPKSKPPSQVLLFFLPLGLSLPKLWLSVIILALADTMGDVLTAKGVQQIGEFPGKSLKKTRVWLVSLMSNPLMLGGIAGYTTAFLTFVCLLSWADISLVRPATAMGYIFSLLGARFWLQEKISFRRFLGIIPIGLGMVLIALPSF